MDCNPRYGHTFGANSPLRITSYYFHPCILKRIGSAVDSLKDDKPGAGTVLRASYKFYFESAHELRRRRRENLRLKTS